MFRGDVAVRYDLDGEAARLLEGGEQVGRRNITDHVVTWTGSFSFYEGVSAFFEIPHYAAQKVTYPEASQMAFDPAVDAGTMLGTPAIADPAGIRGSGVGGTWWGFRGTPLSETLWGDRGDRTTWMLEAAYRFKDKTNLWTYGPRGTRGAGPGAPAFRLGTTISTTKGEAQPYLKVQWTRTGRINTDIVDEDERVVARGVELRPASELDLGLGTELQVAEYGEQGAQVALDFRGTFSYRSWQDIPSGIYLPDVLEASKSQVATESETASVLGQFGVNWRFHEYVQLNVAGEVGTNTPRRAEHFYPVSTGMGSVLWGVTTNLRFRLRDPMFDRLTPATTDVPAAPMAPPVGG
jgi:hypothetical protein